MSGWICNFTAGWSRWRTTTRSIRASPAAGSSTGSGRSPAP